jgi:hypothetical protein
LDLATAKRSIDITVGIGAVSRIGSVVDLGLGLDLGASAAITRPGVTIADCFGAGPIDAASLDPRSAKTAPPGTDSIGAAGAVGAD